MTVLNCPHGMIKLPIDLWYCRLFNQACPVQASINTQNWEQFHGQCLAAPDRQGGIRQAIESGKYTGFHHMPGRYLCPTCKSRKDSWRAYHYPWELQPLSLFVPYDEETLRLEIIRCNIPGAAQFSYLCEKCLNEILAKLGLASSDEQMKEHRGYGEPVNQGEPVSFRTYRSVKERQEGGSPIEGACSWCGSGFDWNDKGESMCYDFFPPSTTRTGRWSFRLCEKCGDRLLGLLEVSD